MADPTEAINIANKRGYQGTFSEFDEDIGWNDFALREYDPQIGRFTTPDPYDQFASGYIGMGNNPVSFMDPSGGAAVFDPHDLGNVFVTAGRTAGISTRALLDIGVTALRTTAQALTAIRPGSFQPPSIQQPGNPQNQPGQPRTDILGSDDDWKPFTKADLINYAQTQKKPTDENSLGGLFEDIFDKYMKENGAIVKSGFHKNNTLMDDASDRNTVPDFASGIYIYEKWILGIPRFWTTKLLPEASIYELKQSKRRGLYLSSNDYQIKGHIDNLAAKFQPYIDIGVRPDFTLVTTFGVAPSPSMSKYADGKNVNFEQQWSWYKIEGGVYQFKFYSIPIY